MASLAPAVTKRARLEHSVLEVARALPVYSELPPSPAGPLIGTHDGKFHCDEALACAMLTMLPQYRDAVVVRTRDSAVLARCDVVVDVGAVYDPAANRFDHHQKTFDGVLGESTSFVTKLSSAGLVYKHFGRDVLDSLTGGTLPVDLLFPKVYRRFVEHLDAIDNGIAVADGPLKYDISTGLSARVSRLYPRWNEDASATVVNAAFRQAVVLTGTELVEIVADLVHSWWPARTLVEEAIAGAAAVDPGGRIIVLGQGGCPWTGHLFAHESEHGLGAHFLHVLYTDNRGMWRVHAVPVEEGSFQSRCALPDAWRGLRDQELVDVCGIPGATFVHASGFIGGNATREGAIAMAKAAVDHDARSAGE